MTALVVRALTHRGRVRERNEDCVGIGGWLSQDHEGTVATVELTAEALAAGLVVTVSDGVGGHAAGDRASRAVVAALHAAHAGNQRDPGALAAAAARGVAAIGLPPEGRPPAATGVWLQVDASGAWLVNVGDSRAYEARDGYLTQLTRDDRSPERNSLTQVIAGDTICAPHVLGVTLRPGSRFVLVSDGVSDVVPHDLLVRLLAGRSATSCAEVLAAALDAGAPDNVTIAICDVPGDSDDGASEAPL